MQLPKGCANHRTSEVTAREHTECSLCRNRKKYQTAYPHYQRENHQKPENGHSDIIAIWREYGQSVWPIRPHPASLRLAHETNSSSSCKSESMFLESGPQPGYPSALKFSMLGLRNR